MKIPSCGQYLLLGCAAIGLYLASASVVHAQARIEAEAFAGQPYGVGRVIVQIAPGARSASGEDAGLSEKSERLFYPAYESEPVRQILRQIIAAPQRTTIYFLFQGDRPLQLSWYAPGLNSVTVTPRNDKAGYNRLLSAWWRQFSPATRRSSSSASDYPPVVENYLSATLARRLKLPATALGKHDPAENILGVLAGTESMRLALEQQMLLGSARPEAADQPLPEPLDTPPINVPEVADDVAIEPIAMRVPAECFYLRTGSFANFQWFQHRLNDWGGDLRNLISQRGVNYGLNDRFQRQIALKETALAKLLGDTVIADVAMIGMDPFLREGAAMGLLFQARNNLALGTDFKQQRAAALQAIPNSTEDILKIAEHDVSLISTPDNVLRSFYVVDGDFHLVTTSRAIVERFLEVSQNQGAGSLGASSEFRYARELMPVERKYAAFVYLSDAFFQNLVSPQYRIEMRRRLQALGEIELVHVARLAARGEHYSAETIDELIEGGYLPAGFGQRPDGSQLVFNGDAITDSARGGRGTFTPIPDIAIGGVTASEAKEFVEFARYYQTEWQQMDPILVGIQRRPLFSASVTGNDDLERVVIDVQAAPFAPKHFQMLSMWLGAPLQDRIAPAPGDLVAAQVSLQGKQFFAHGDYQMFGALRDPDPTQTSSPPSLLSSLLMSGMPQNVRGYVGAWPEVGWLGLAGASLKSRSDANGYTKLATGIWRRQFDQFTLLSMHPEVLEAVTPGIGFVPSDRPAQVRLWASDLTGTALGQQLNDYGFKYAQEASQVNVRLLQSLVEQLHLPPSECLAAAELILDAQIVSPLGGNYELARGKNGQVTWAVVDRAAAGGSAAVFSNGSKAPAGYVFPALNWLRGIDLDLQMQASTLALHAEIDMPAETRAPFQLPKLPATPAAPKPGSSKPAKPETIAPELPRPADADPDELPIPIQPPSPTKPRGKDF